MGFNSELESKKYSRLSQKADSLSACISNRNLSMIYGCRWGHFRAAYKSQFITP